jgi:hypothetical protein
MRIGIKAKPAFPRESGLYKFYGNDPAVLEIRKVIIVERNDFFRC